MNINGNNEQPLGSRFKSYELNSAINYYLLDPYQYSITKFNYSDNKEPPGPINTLNPETKLSSNCTVTGDFSKDPGLVYKDIDFEKLIPAYTAEKKSVNDIPAQSYHRFLANDGYFNPNEGNNNTDLWYYGAVSPPGAPGVTGATLNVQEVNHIIFPEAQRGGVNSTNLAKYSNPNSIDNKTSWNPSDCKFFNWNSGYSSNAASWDNFNQAYYYDSNYCRKIGISPPQSGSMPFYQE